MSTSIAKASRLKPEIRLAQAISQYESELSGEQKAAFGSHKAQTLKSPPVANDVMRLTAEIDRQMSRKFSGRCFGPRFTNFLQGVQQFAALGDVIVGGSQNIIACSVWALVRISLLSFTSFTSYFDKLSTMFMKVGRSAPRYENMAIIFPRSKALRDHLSEYFIVVVKFCQSLLKITTQSTIKQITSTLNDSDLKSFQNELDFWAVSIKEEVSLLVANRIEEEARENSKFRALSNRLSKSASHHQRIAMNLRVLDFCSKYDYNTTWKRIRKAGNTSWYSQTTEYQNWMKQTSSCTIICTGTLGSGKSVLLANLIAGLSSCDEMKAKNTPVAYFFCRHDLPESLTARTVLGSLTRQILSALSDLTTVAHLCNETSPTSAFMELLLGALSSDYKVYIVLDGINECEQFQRGVIEEFLSQLQKSFHVLLCTSERLEPTNGSENTKNVTNIPTISIPENNSDIEVFIEAELENCLLQNKLVVGDPKIVLEIQDTLVGKSQGMFLWVALQIQRLCTLKTDKAIKDALADLPKGLSETYRRILQKSGESGTLYQSQILQLVAVAHRYLTINELREALSVIPGVPTWNPDRLLNDIFSALACCGCLLTIDEEDSTIRFVHHSVKQFLVDHFIDADQSAFTLAKAQRTMADIIVTYLSYNVFETRLTGKRLPEMNMQTANSAIIRSTDNSSSPKSIQKLALSLLKSRKQPNFDIGKTLANAVYSSQYKTVEEFHFYSYAKLHWPLHLFYISGQDSIIYDLAVQTIQRIPTDFNELEVNLWLPVKWAAENGNQSITKVLLVWKRLDVKKKNPEGVSLVSQAVMYGNEVVTRLLLEAPNLDVNGSATVPVGIGGCNRAPLHLAAATGHTSIVQLLLEVEETNVDKKEPETGDTPLCIAAHEGHIDVMKLLLATGKVDVNAEYSDGETILTKAIRFVKRDIITLLLATGKLNHAKNREFHKKIFFEGLLRGFETQVHIFINDLGFNVNSRDVTQMTPLMIAADYGSISIVKMLLDNESIDKNPRDISAFTPLHYAASRGRAQVVGMLIATQGVDLDARDCNWQTPFFKAVKNGHVSVVELLLKTGRVDIEARDVAGLLPFSFAAKNGNAALVERLFRAGAFQNSSPNGLDQLSLVFAAEKGHMDILKLIVATGKFNVNTKDEHGHTALSKAALNGHDSVVKLLLDNLADICLEDTIGNSPLVNAAGHGHLNIVKLLLEASEFSGAAIHVFGKRALVAGQRKDMTT